MNTRLKRNIPNTLDKLCALFDAELDRQMAVQRACKEQGDAARRSDMKVMQASTESLTVLMEGALYAERVRVEILRWIVDYYGLAVEDHTLTDLIAVVPYPWNERLSVFQTKIKAILCDTQLIIKANERFMNHAADQLDESIHSAVDQVSGQPDGYNPAGMESKGYRQPALFNAVG